MTDSILSSYRYHTQTTQIPFTAQAALFLDTYTGAIAAYSFRKLRTAYAGSAVRMRRSSDNAEADIGFDVDGNFDTSAASSHIGGGSGFIAKWYDQTTSGLNIAQTNASQQPPYVASGIGSKPCLNFDAASSSKLVSTGGSPATVAYPTVTTASMFAVFILADTGHTDGMLFGMFDPSSGAAEYNSTQNFSFQVANAVASNIVVRRNNVDLGDTGVTFGTAISGGCIFTGTNAVVYKNGAGTSEACTDGNFANDSHTIEVRMGTRVGGAQWNGQCSEAVLWSANMTSSASGIDADHSSYYGV